MKIHRASPQEQIERISREAVEWMQILQAKPAAAERSAFASWLVASPAHAREMLLAGMLDRELSASGVLDSFDVEAIVAKARAEDNVVPLSFRASRKRTAPRHDGRVWLRVAAVAAVFVTGAMGWIAIRSYLDSGTQYATAIGEQRAIELDDGTQIVLAPGSRILVDFSATRRRVTLRQGEAEFDVAHDASRPFAVYAGANKIRDIGTRFAVNRLPSGTIVSVTEGSVQVTLDHLASLGGGFGEWAASWLPADLTPRQRPGTKVVALEQGARLVAGQSARIARDGKALSRGRVDEESMTPGKANRLVFRDDILDDIVAEFNRYNTTQIVIDGDALRMQRYSGVFDATDAASFLQFLDCCSDVAVVRHADRWVIQPRKTARAQSH